ncbi:MAG: sialate O-acetylesterase, partial [Asticcacaulis sp.]|nr:sialate O-acetylesterase [Asticcacaulis sp.]
MTLRKSVTSVCVAVLGLLPIAAVADVRLPHIFSDHLVLQAGTAMPVWGWADPGEHVVVRIAGQTRRATATSDGRWQVELVPIERAATPVDMTIKGKANTVTIADVLVGEVWLASGQSNMEKPLGEQPGQKPTFNYEAELQAADHPDIRLFKVKKARGPIPADDVDGAWMRCDPQSLDKSKFSAAAYYFGRKLNAELKTPVGLIDSTWGGTRIEPWTPPSGFAAAPSLKAFTDASPAGPKVEGTNPSTLYNGMVAPLVPFALKGVIWYQGESNIIDNDDGAGYADKMTALVGGWRTEFKRDLSFYYVQVAPHLYHVVRPATVVSPEATPRLWEAQTAALRLPKTGMIVTTDLVDDLFDIHPRDKKTVGERLANLALSNDYGRAGLATSGPMYR